MKKNGFLLFLIPVLLLTVSSCKKWDEESGPTDIRIRNLSPHLFNDIYVDTSEDLSGSDEFDFGDLGPSQETEYHRFKKAYRQALLKITIDGTRYTFTPVSYTYEVYLGRGKFTYEVWTEETGGMKLNMRVGDDMYPLD